MQRVSHAMQLVVNLLGQGDGKQNA